VIDFGSRLPPFSSLEGSVPVRKDLSNRASLNDAARDRTQHADDEPLFTLEPVRRWLGFARRSVRRHPLLAVLTFVGMLLLTGIALLSAPASYTTGITILLRPEQIDQGFESSDASVIELAGLQADGIIRSQESLDMMIDEAGLLQRPELPPFGKLKEAVFGKATGEDERRRLREELSAAIVVTLTTTGESVNVAVTWPDPVQAARIADLSFQAFYENRRVTEVVGKQKGVEVLQSEVDAVSASVDELYDELNLGPGDTAPQGSRLETLVFTQRDLQDRLLEARLDLERSTQGLQFRYAQLEPAVVPVSPVAGNLPNMIAVIFLSVVAAGLVCTIVDLRRRKVVEPWQIERLDIPVLALLQDESPAAR
jgi:uncharacterized protein involved in exopolysaccharide biosynthesis